MIDRYITGRFDWFMLKILVYFILASCFSMEQLNHGLNKNSGDLVIKTSCCWPYDMQQVFEQFLIDSNSIK